MKKNINFGDIYYSIIPLNERDVEKIGIRFAFYYFHVLDNNFRR